MIISQEILNKCLRNEQQAYKHCYEACAPYVYTIIKSYIYEESYRRDVMQDVFAQIFKSLKNYNPQIASFKTWITSITIHCSIAHLRKKKKLNMIVSLESATENDLSFDEKPIDQLSRSEILKLMEKMPTGYRTVFLLSVIDDYNHKQIAELLGTSVENSRSQLSRALQWARKNISKESLIYIYG